VGDLGDVYDDSRRSLVDLLVGLGDEELARRVPACPDWTIKDVAAHLTGVAEDWIRAGGPREFIEPADREDAVVRLDEWTAAQVAERADKSIKEIVDEWADYAAVAVSIIKGETPPPPNALMFADRILVTDLAAHTHDVYGALGIVRDRDSAPVKIAASTYIGWLDIQLQAADGPALTVDAGDRRWVVGGNDPDATVRADRFEFFRALSGRRGPDQIRALYWEGDPEPFVPFFYPYSPRRDALIE
jgi:uncharacterized protein (TIGR03083 family)